MRKKQLLSMFVTILLVVSLFTQGVTANKNDSDYKSVVYYISWAAESEGEDARQFFVNDMNAQNITHVNYAFAKIVGENRPDSDLVNGNCYTPEEIMNYDGEGRIDHLNCNDVHRVTFADPDKDIGVGNSVEEAWSGNFEGNFKDLIEFKEVNPHVETLISVGGWTMSNYFSDMALTKESREVFIDSVLEFIRTFGFDGVDLDWEYPGYGGEWHNDPRPEDKENFTHLLRELRAALNQAGEEDDTYYSLTIAVAANASNYLAHTEIPEIMEYLDWINLMTYDMSGPWDRYDFDGEGLPWGEQPFISGFNAPLYGDSLDPWGSWLTVQGTVDTYLAAGVKPQDMVLGTAFYGRSWTNCESDRNNGMFDKCYPDEDGIVAGSGTWERGVLDYWDIQENYLTDSSFKRYWSEEARVPWLYNQETGEVITYDDEQSIAEKMNFIKEYQLGGAMVWEITQDRDGSLMNVIYEHLLHHPLEPVDPPNVIEPPDEEEPPSDPTEPVDPPGEEEPPSDPLDPVDPPKEEKKKEDDNKNNDDDVDQSEDEDNGEKDEDDLTSIDKNVNEGEDVKGDKLPNTATNQFTYLLIGLLITVAGIFVAFVTYRKKKVTID